MSNIKIFGEHEPKTVAQMRRDSPWLSVVSRLLSSASARGLVNAGCGVTIGTSLSHAANGQ